jgi:hypothetical protein
LAADGGSPVSGAIRLRRFVAPQQPVYGSVLDAPTRAVPFVTEVLSRQTNFLVYCEQKGDDCAQMAYTLRLWHRFLYSAACHHTFGPMSDQTAKNSRKALTSELPQ